jgi:vacuolar-type H+-ATPase subunit I/STV1
MKKFKLKLSYIIGFLTMTQYVYTVGVYNQLWKNIGEFNLMHEDTVFIMHLMTWIVVAAIEQLIDAVNRQPNIDINIYDSKNEINCTIDRGHKKTLYKHLASKKNK